MADVTMAAPANPYRRTEERYDFASSALVPFAEPVMRADTERGPGLTAADIDAIARTHHRAGHAKAEREAERKIEEMQAQLATAYDLGYTAGRVERAQGLAKDVEARLLGVHFALMAAENGSKSKAHGALAVVRAQLRETEEFVRAISFRDDAAAAQMVRDEEG